MIVLALLLLLLAAAAVVFILVVGTSQAVTFTFFAGSYQTRPVWIFAGGALALLFAEGGVALLRQGARRKLAQRREIKRLRQIEQSGGASAPTANTTPGGAQPGPDPDEHLVRQPRASEDPPADQVPAQTAGARLEDEQPRGV